MSDTGCSSPDCEKKFSRVIEENAKDITGHAKTLYGEDGRGGLVKEYEEIKNDVKYFKNKILDSETGRVLFIKKVHPAIWVPILIFILAVAGGTVYNAKASASKEDLKDVENKVSLINNTICGIKDSQDNLFIEIKDLRKEVKVTLKDQAESLQKQNEIYYKNLRDLMSTLHDVPMKNDEK